MIIGASSNDATLNLAIVGRSPDSLKKGAGSQKDPPKKQKKQALIKSWNCQPYPKIFVQSREGMEMELITHGQSFHRLSYVMNIH